MAAINSVTVLKQKLINAQAVVVNNAINFMYFCYVTCLVKEFILAIIMLSSCMHDLFHKFVAI